MSRASELSSDVIPVVARPELALDKLAVHAETAVSAVTDSNALTFSLTLLFAIVAVGFRWRCGSVEGKSGETITGFNRARFVVSGVIEGVSETLDRRRAPTGK